MDSVPEHTEEQADDQVLRELQTARARKELALLRGEEERRRIRAIAEMWDREGVEPNPMSSEGPDIQILMHREPGRGVRAYLAREDASAVRRELEAIKRERQSQSETHTTGRPPKDLDYVRACELWREFTDQYVPNYRQNTVPALRSFFPWLVKHYRHEAVGATKFGELKSEWEAQGLAFPPIE